MIYEKSQFSSVSSLARLRKLRGLGEFANVSHSELAIEQVDDLAGGRTAAYQRQIQAEFGGDPWAVRGFGRRVDPGGDFLQKFGKSVFNQIVGYGLRRGENSRGQMLADLGQALTRAINRNN